MPDVIEKLVAVFQDVATQARMKIYQKQKTMQEHPQLMEARSLLYAWVLYAREEQKEIERAVKRAKRACGILE